MTINKLIKYLVLLFIIPAFFYNISLGQGINNNWLMGYSSFSGLPYGNTFINYSSGTPIIVYDSLEMEFNQTCANISNDQGNLLFYSNGIYIADASHDTMSNGFGLNPSPYTSSVPEGLLLPQANLILKKPGNSFIYYLFHSTVDTFPASNPFAHHLYLTTIDMNGNGGLGTVIQKNYSLIDDTLNIGKITATRHANGRDWWVVCHKGNSNLFYKLLVTPFGLPTISSQNIGTITGADVGQAKFSSNGLWFAYYFYGSLDIYNFDRCSGQFSNYIHDNLPAIIGNVGCEISPYSDMLYVSNVTQVFQYILGVPNIIATKQIVATYDGFYDPIGPSFGTYLCLPQLAPDGKIYITTGNSTHYFHTIHYPYFPGVACSLAQHDLVLPALYFNTIPNHPNYFLGALTGSVCDSLTGLGNNEQSEIKLNAWPNPANEFCTISFPVQSYEGNLEIYDVWGNKVFEEKVAPWSQIKKVDMQRFPTGIYLIQINWKDQIASVKILKE